MPLPKKPFEPHHLLATAPPKAIEDLGALCDSTTAMVADVLRHLLIVVYGSLEAALAQHQLTLWQMMRITSEAIRRHKMAVPHFRLVWTTKMGTERVRECIGAIRGDEADAEPPVTNDLTDLLKLYNVAPGKVSEVTGIPLPRLQELLVGQGAIRRPYFVALGEMLRMTPAQIVSAFYEGCRRASKKDPAYPMYPRQPLKPAADIVHKVVKTNAQTLSLTGCVSESIIQMPDGALYKVTLQKLA